MPLSLLQVILLALLQGVTELFPVSSLGHAVVIPAALLWPFDPKGPGMLPFLVILHMGTAIALLIFYWREWWKLLLALLGGGDPAERAGLRRQLLMLVIATIPAAIVGAVANRPLREAFAVPAVAAGFLLINGVSLYVLDPTASVRWRRIVWGVVSFGIIVSLVGYKQYLIAIGFVAVSSLIFYYIGIKKSPVKSLDNIRFIDAIVIGFAQCFALIPGISRSGLTITAGLNRNLSSDAASHFSFLMATPIIGGAAVLEVPKLLHGISTGRVDSEYLRYSLIGGLVAGAAALLSVWILTRYFRLTEPSTMKPFAIYCALIGVASLALFISRG